MVGFLIYRPHPQRYAGFFIKLPADSTMDEVLSAIDTINTDYRRHCEAARVMAEDYFEASKVAGRLLADVGL